MEKDPSFPLSAATPPHVEPGDDRFRTRDLPILELRAGMVLARPLELSLDAGTPLKLPAGLVLSEATLGLLFAYKVTQATVYETTAGKPQEPPAGTRERQP